MPPATVLTVAIPAAIFIAGVYWMYSTLTRSLDPFHLSLLVGTAAVLAASVALAGAGLGRVEPPRPRPRALVTVVGYELRGHRHNAEVLANL